MVAGVFLTSECRDRKKCAWVYIMTNNFDGDSFVCICYFTLYIGERAPVLAYVSLEIQVNVVLWFTMFCMNVP